MNTLQLPSYFLPRPPMELDADTTAVFDRLFSQSVQEGIGAAINYNLRALKWQFLCHLCETKDVVLHGSGDPGIEEFEPRQSNDIEEFGNRQAVYAASDGIWAMYFAIANRDGPVRSLTNACFRLIDEGGRRSEPFYFFSINDDAFESNPWRDGTIYILPRETFEQQALRDHKGLDLEIEQWASLEPVKPLARLAVSPSDFPFLSQVRAHNERTQRERINLDPGGFPWLDGPTS